MRSLNRDKTKSKAFSLMEVVLVMALFSILVFSVTSFSIDTLRFSENRWQKNKASFLIQEIGNAILANKNDMWRSVVQNTNAGLKHLDFLSNKYQIADGVTTVDGIGINFQIQDVYRDTNGNIVTSGGTQDLNSRAININTSWTDKFGFVNSITNTVYATNWNTLSLTETTQADFQDGINTDTLVTSTNAGSVELDLAFQIQGDWCNPSLSITTFDLQRQGNPTAISAIPNYAYLSTGGNASGPTLESVNISSANPPVVTQLQSYNSADKVNDIYADASYTYLSTDTNAEDVQIIQTTTNPYTKVGYFDAATSTNANDVWVSGNTGYLTQGSKLRSFDLSSKTGSRPQLGTVNLSGTGADLKVVGNYAYVSISGSTTTELEIIDITNPSNMSVIGSANTDSASATSLYVKSDGTRVYLGTLASATQKEVFIIDTSTKTGSRTILSSLETNGMSVNDISVVEVDNRLIVGGTGGIEYQIYRINSEITPSLCGSLNNDNGIYGVATVTDGLDNAWAYVLTGNASQELMIILGGETNGGGGNGHGTKYITTGNYLSNVIDTGSETTQYYLMSWFGQTFANTDLRVQVRTGSTSDLSSVGWFGPDGTSNTYFSQSGSYLPDISQSKRYLQYKVIFDSDKVNTPIFENIKFNYQK
jgi:hypothetical protein